MLLVKNGTLYTMENEEPINADLLVKNGKIAKIGKNIKANDDVQGLGGSTTLNTVISRRLPDGNNDNGRDTSARGKIQQVLFEQPFPVADGL